MEIRKKKRKRQKRKKGGGEKEEVLLADARHQGHSTSHHRPIYALSRIADEVKNCSLTFFMVKLTQLLGS